MSSLELEYHTSDDNSSHNAADVSSEHNLLWRSSIEENYSIFHNPIRQVHFDVDSQSNAEIISRLTTTLGKSKETLAEEAEKEAEKNNPANFGLNFG